MKRSHRSAFTVVVVPCVLALLALGYAFANSRVNRTYAPYAAEPYPASEIAALARHHGGSLATFRTTDGIAITGVVRDPPTRDGGWLVGFAGNGGGQIASQLALFAAADPQHQLGWAAFPFRGFDSAPGTPTFRAMHSDARALVRFLVATHGAAPSRMHVVGFSLGTDVAIQLVTDPELHESFASLILLAPWVTPYCQLVPGRVHRYLPTNDCSDPRSRLGRIHSPTLIVHGGNDAVHPLAEAHEAARGIRHARLVVIPGGAHIDALSSYAATRAVARFLAEHAVHAPTATAPRL